MHYFIYFCSEWWLWSSKWIVVSQWFYYDDRCFSIGLGWVGIVHPNQLQAFIFVYLATIKIWHVMTLSLFSNYVMGTNVTTIPTCCNTFMDIIIKITMIFFLLFFNTKNPLGLSTNQTHFLTLLVTCNITIPYSCNPLARINFFKWNSTRN